MTVIGLYDARVDRGISSETAHRLEERRARYVVTLHLFLSLLAVLILFVVLGLAVATFQAVGEMGADLDRVVETVTGGQSA